MRLGTLEEMGSAKGRQTIVFRKRREAEQCSYLFQVIESVRSRVWLPV